MTVPSPSAITPRPATPAAPATARPPAEPSVAAALSVAPSYPLGRWAIVPHREPAPRTQCAPCAGGGDINGLPCRDCDGRGYFDEHNPPPKGP